MYRLCLWKEQVESVSHWIGNVVMVTTQRLRASAVIVIIDNRGAAGSREGSRWLSFSFQKQWEYQCQFNCFLPCPAFIIHIYLSLQCLIPYSNSPITCYLVNINCIMYSIITVYALPFGWPPCQQSDMTLMGVSQCAYYDVIYYLSWIYGYLYICGICVNLIWYLYLFMFNKFCLSLSMSMSRIIRPIVRAHHPHSIHTHTHNPIPPTSRL